MLDLLKLFFGKPFLFLDLLISLLDDILLIGEGLLPGRLDEVQQLAVLGLFGEVHDGPSEEERADCFQFHCY